jgi:hypothetical protein
MTGDSRDSLDLQDTSCRGSAPLHDGLRRDAERPRQLGIGAGAATGFQKGGGLHMDR